MVSVDGLNGGDGAVMIVIEQEMCKFSHHFQPSLLHHPLCDSLSRRGVEGRGLLACLFNICTVLSECFNLILKLE